MHCYGLVVNTNHALTNIFRSTQPILFHYSQSLAGSTIAKNSIRNSQHGCIVLSSTDDVIVAENIAFDTVGHCFVLKDGSETGNTFRSNLGAMTRLSGAFEPIYSANEEVLDSSPATFLISNPSNVIEGNVGAGSEGEAFAIVLESKVRGTHFLEHRSVDPASLPLTAFRGNVAHSNKVVSCLRIREKKWLIPHCYTDALILNSAEST